MLDGLSATAPCGAPPAALATIAAVLACPMCRAELEIEANSVPLLAVHGASETWSQPQKIGQSEARQAEYQQVGSTATYNLEYQRTQLKRSSTRREYSLIDRHIRRVGHARAVLDIPCGDGPREAGVNP